MASTACIYCRESHPASTAFCPNTGKALGPSAVSGESPVDRGAASPPPNSPSTSPRATASGSAGGAAGNSLPSAVTDPPAAATGGDPPASTPEAGVLDLLQRALDLYKKHAKLLLTVAAVVFVPGALAHACARAAILAPTVALTVAIDPATHLPIAAPFAGSSVVAGFTVVLLGLLAAAVTGLFLHGIVVPLTHGALALAAADRIAGGNAGWREIWAWLFRRLGTVLSAIIPAALLTGVGFFFLVLPGLVLAFFFAFVPTIALFEGIGGTAALRRSYELVKSDWLRMLLVLLVFGLISAVAQVLAGMIPAGLFLSRLLQDALTLVAMPIPVLGSVLLYFDVRRKHDPGGFSEQKLSEEMQTLRS
jgi:hypothetical protein